MATGHVERLISGDLSEVIVREDEDTQVLCNLLVILERAMRLAEIAGSIMESVGCRIRHHGRPCMLWQIKRMWSGSYSTPSNIVTVPRWMDRSLTLGKYIV